VKLILHQSVLSPSNVSYATAIIHYFMLACLYQVVYPGPCTKQGFRRMYIDAYWPIVMLQLPTRTAISDIMDWLGGQDDCKCLSSVIHVTLSRSYFSASIRDIQTHNYDTARYLCLTWLRSNSASNPDEYALSG
jgi:hypothetical protein